MPMLHARRLCIRQNRLALHFSGTLSAYGFRPILFFSIEGNFVLITFVNRNLLAIVSPPAFQERHHILVSMISVIFFWEFAFEVFYKISACITGNRLYICRTMTSFLVAMLKFNETAGRNIFLLICWNLTVRQLESTSERLQYWLVGQWLFPYQ